MAQMMKASQGKSPYEIRADLLGLAFSILQYRHSVSEGETRSPTTEEVVNEAQKLNDFVSTSNR